MIHIDFETRSACDLLRAGIYNYAVHPTTTIICMGWAIGDGAIDLWVPGAPLPGLLFEALVAGELIAAWNAQFERLIWNSVLVHHGFPALSIERFYCVAALSRTRGFPGKLENAARFAGSPYRKDMEGHHLMLKLCKPRRIEEDGSIVWWDYAPDYERLGEYCKQDVAVERAMFESFVPFTSEELSNYHLSERINDRGMPVDLELARAATAGAEGEGLSAVEVLTSLTSGRVTAHTQVARILDWIEGEWKRLPNLAKPTVWDSLQEPDIPYHVSQVLEIRLENAKAAVLKFSTMLDCNIDGVVRGLFMFHGAGQTGRFTAHGVQIHNLPTDSAVGAIPILKRRGVSGLKILGNPVQLLSQMVRPAFLAAPGHTLLIGDFAQIEARITAWLAGEDKLLRIFWEGGDPYCAFGSMAYKRAITKADINERKASKACVLGLGFGGGEGALNRSLKKDNIILPADEITHLINTYRETYSRIRAYWYRLRDAVLLAMYSRGTIIDAGLISYLFDGEHLWCRLPSGRLMCYPFAKIVNDEWGDSVEYQRGNRSPKNGATEWPTVRLWHGMLMENLAQAIAFDLLMEALVRLKTWSVRMHVHDEIVVEVKTELAEKLLPKFTQIMSEVPPWAEGLPIATEGIISERYV